MEDSKDFKVPPITPGWNEFNNPVTPQQETFELTCEDFGIAKYSPRNELSIFLKTLPKFKSEDSKEQIKILILSVVNLLQTGVIRRSNHVKFLQNIRRIAEKINV